MPGGYASQGQDHEKVSANRRLHHRHYQRPWLARVPKSAEEFNAGSLLRDAALKSGRNHISPSHKISLTKRLASRRPATNVKDIDSDSDRFKFWATLVAAKLYHE